MDPDMVRQQFEAEREASAFLAKKLAGPAAGGGGPKAAPGEGGWDREASHAAEFSAREGGRPEMEPYGAETEPYEPEAGPVSPGAAFFMAAQAGRAISFGLAGTILGGGFGIALASYMQLSEGWARLAIFGPAATVGVCCAAASFFAKTRHE